MPKILPYTWTPRDIDDAILTLYPSHVDMLRQEQFASNATNQVSTAAAYSSPVGTVFFPQDGHVATALSDAYRPTLQPASGGRNNFLRFGYGSQPSAISVQNSTGAMRSIWTTQQYTIAFWIRMGSNGSVGGDGVQQIIMDCNGYANTDPGFYIQRYSDNTLQFLSSKSGAWLCTAGISSSNLTVSSGWQPVVIQGRGAGTNTGTMAIGGSIVGGVFVPTVVATFNLASGATIGTDSGFNLYIGETATGGQHAQFDLDNLLIAGSVISAADLTRWYNFNPAQNSGSLVRHKRESTELDPDELSHLFMWHNASSPSFPKIDQPSLFTTSGASTAVASSGDTIGYIEHLGGSHLKRWMSQSNSPELPTWQVGNINGRPGAYFNGSWNSGSTITAPNDWQFNQQLPPGDKTIYVVCQQNGAAPSNGAQTGQVGGHLYNLSTNSVAYTPVTSAYYAPPNQFLIHPTNDPSFAGTQSTTIPYLTTTATTSPATAGTYLLTTGVCNSVYYYYCAATSQYLWFASNNWVISAAPGVTGGGYFSSPHQAQADTYTAAGTATGTPLLAGSGNGSNGTNIYMLQQRGAFLRSGVNGAWSPWVSTAGSLCYDNIGKDGHQNVASPSATAHWELNGIWYEHAIYNYAHTDYNGNKVLRRWVNKYNLQNVTLAQ